MKTLWVLGAVSMTGLSACVVAPDQSHSADGLVMVAPPAPQVEVMGTPPEAGYLWIGGYWDWVGGRHQWVQGHWVAPRAGYHWVPAEWVRQGDGWRLRRGHWQRR